MSSEIRHQGCAKPAIFAVSPESDSRESAMQSISPAFMAAASGVTPGTVTKVAFRATTVAGAARKVAVFATPPMRTLGCVYLLDFRNLCTRAHKICALQQVIGIAEVDEFFRCVRRPA